MGAATGLGNALRFPALCVTYGGGFLIAYTLCVALVCFPLLCAELSLGKIYSESYKNSLSRLCPRFAFIALSACLNSAVIALYYGLITAQMGRTFLCFAFTGGTGGESFPLLCACGVLGGVCIALICGKQNAMARTGKMCVVCFLSLLLVLAAAAAINGGDLSAVFAVHFGDFLCGGIWADALGQSLLALSLAGGVMPSFARSFGGGFNVTRAAVKICAANVCACFLAAVCALSYPLPFPQGGGIALAHSLYPAVIAAAFPARACGRAFGILFFATLSAVAVQSSLSLFAPIVALAGEKRRGRAGALCGAFSVLLLPVFAANGGEMMNVADRVACSVNAVAIAFAESLIFATPHSMARFRDEIDGFSALSLRFLCPFCCGALALFAACGARFSGLSPASCVCGLICFAAVFSPAAAGIWKNLRDISRFFMRNKVGKGRGQSHKNL